MMKHFGLSISVSVTRSASSETYTVLILLITTTAGCCNLETVCKTTRNSGIETKTIEDRSTMRSVKS